MAFSISTTSTNVNEGAGSITFLVARDTATAVQTVYFSTILNGSTNASGYTPMVNQPLTFAAGVSSLSVTVSLVRDMIDEPNQTFGVIVQETANANPDVYLARQLYTIVDDDDPDDFAGNATTQGTVSVGGSVTGRLGAPGDIDWFRVQLNAGTPYTISLDGMGSTADALSDPYLYVHDGAGRFLGSNDDGGPGINSELTFIPQNTGDYYVSARSYADKLTGDYEIKVASAGGPVADVAGSTSTSATIKVGESVQGNLETIGDADWFKVNMTAGITYTIELEGAGGGGGSLADPFLRLHSGTGALIGSNDDGGAGADSLLNFTPTVTGDYFVSARAYGDRGAGSYTVNVATGVAPPGPVADPPGIPAEDLPANANTTGTIAAGGTVGGRLDVAGDADWFKVDMTVGNTYTIDLKGVAGGGGSLVDPFLYLYNDAGALLGSNDDGGAGADSRLVFTPTVAGTYFVSARSYGDQAAGSYQVGVTVAAPPADVYPRDTTTPGWISYTGMTLLSSLEAAGDSDWFKIAMTVGNVYTLHLRGASSGGGSLADPFLYLYDSTGNLLGSNDDGGDGNDAMLYFTPTASGDYFLEARAFGDRLTGSYSVSYDEAAVPAQAVARSDADDLVGLVQTVGTPAPSDEPLHG